jgi:glycosyltransferase involved in cell wall biosynthesis
MKIAILSSFEDLLCRDTGSSVRIYSLAKHLAMLGNEVHVIIPKDKDDAKRVDGFVVHEIKGFCPMRILELVGKGMGASKVTAAYFYDLLFISKASRITRECNVVQLEQQFAGGFVIPVVKKMQHKILSIDCHDVFQAIRVRHTKGFRRILETFIEIFAYEHSDLILTVSEKEKTLVKASGFPESKIKIVPNGVDVKFFRRKSNTRRIRERYRINGFKVVVFVGNMEYLPNQEAVRVINDEIAPRVMKSIPGVRFLVVGRTPKDMVLPNVVLTGVVSDVAEILSVADIAIAPLFHGSGTRLKILEYLSCGLPVVATSVAVEGLEVDSGRNFVVENDIEDFAERVIEVLSDETSSKQMSEIPTSAFVEKYDWNRIAERLCELYEDMLYTR